MSKGDPGEKQSKKRVAFASRHASKTFQQWQSYCQGCGDLKEFTWYPRELQPQFKRLRASWTYMTKAEKKKPDFQRPKKWFPKNNAKLCDINGNEAPQTRIQTISILLVILTIGIVLSILLMLGEIFILKPK